MGAILCGRRVPRGPVFQMARRIRRPSATRPSRGPRGTAPRAAAAAPGRRAPPPGRAACGASAGRRDGAPARRASTSAARPGCRACRRAVPAPRPGGPRPRPRRRRRAVLASASPAARATVPAPASSRRPCASTSRSTSAAVARWVVSLPPVMPTSPGRVHSAESRPIADGARCASPGGTTMARSAGEGRRAPARRRVGDAGTAGAAPRPGSRPRPREIVAGSSASGWSMSVVPTSTAPSQTWANTGRRSRGCSQARPLCSGTVARANTRWLPRSGRSTGAPGDAPAQTPVACTVTVAGDLGAGAADPVFEARAGDAAAALDQGHLDMVERAPALADGVEDQAQHQPRVVDDAVAVGDRRAPRPSRAECRLEREGLRPGAIRARGAPAGHASAIQNAAPSGARPGAAALVDRHQKGCGSTSPGARAAAARARAPTRASSATAPT